MKTTVKKTNRKSSRKQIPWRTLLPWFIIAGVLAAIAVGALIYSSLTDEDGKDVPRFEYENGQYYDAERDITYLPAPFYFEAVLNASADYPYAESNRWPLYQVGYRDDDGKVHLKQGSAWLTTQKSVGGQVYYNPAEVKFPEMKDFDWEAIYFSNPGSGQFSTYTMPAGETHQLMTEFLSEDNPDLYGSIAMDELDPKLILRVSSGTYRWLYLNLTLYADKEDNYYLCPEGVQLMDEPFLVSIDKVYFEDYLKTLEDIIGSTS